MEQHKSTSTQSGLGGTTFTIAHGCPITPFYVSVIGKSPDSLVLSHSGAFIPFYYTWDSNDITISYFTAPDAGTDNLTWVWSAECS